MRGPCSIKTVEGELGLILVYKATMNLLLLMHRVEQILIIYVDHWSVHRCQVLAVLKAYILTGFACDALLSANVLHAHRLLEHLRLVVIVAQCRERARWRWVHTV